MKSCPNCGTGVTPDLRFCLECGAPLAQQCPSCGAPRVPGARFCGQCGTRFDGEDAASVQSAGPEAHRPAVGGAARAGGAVGDTGADSAHGHGTASGGGPQLERRVVSVLFADLVGFTARSESQDPEEVREFLTRYFDAAGQVIARYGGVVEKFIGDAVMAVFGTPVAHEDDAERAVRAALDLVDAVHGLDEPRPGRPRLRQDTDPGAGRRDDRRCRRDRRGDGPGYGRRRPRQHHLAAPGGRGTRVGARGRDDATRCRHGHCVRARGGACTARQEPPCGGVARHARRRRARRTRADSRPGTTVRWPRGGAAAAQGPAPRDRPRGQGASRHGLRRGRHGQEPAHVGVPQVRRRPHGGRVLALRSLPGVRRRDRLLGARRDGSQPRRDRRVGGRRHSATEARRSRGPVRPR